MKIFNCQELHNLVKKVVDEKLIDECADTFAVIVRSFSFSSLHFLSYNEMIAVCAALDEYTGICNIKQHEEYGTLYSFMISAYDRKDFLAIAEEVFSIEDYDPSDYTFKVIFENERDEDGDWYPIFLVREFWEFCKNFMNKDEKENKENMNNKTTETKEKTLSIHNIYKIIADSEGFEKIIEGMEDIGFTDETIYEVILNLVKRLD